jgi:hypothetical protein
MLHADEFLKGQDQIQCSLGSLEDAQRLAKPRRVKQTESIRESALEPHEIRLSGSQLVIALASALGTVCLLIWAFLRLWLFEG